MFRTSLRLGSFVVISLLVAAGCSKPVYVDLPDAGDAGVDSGVNNPCDFTTGVGCQGGLDCVRHVQTGGVLATTCEVAGTLGEGAPCGADADCLVGSICAASTGGTGEKTCHVLCDATSMTDTCPNNAKGSVCALVINGGSSPTPGTLNALCTEACTPTASAPSPGCTNGVVCQAMVGTDPDGGVPLAITFCSNQTGGHALGDTCQSGGDCNYGLVCYFTDSTQPGTCRLPCDPTNAVACLTAGLGTCNRLPSSLMFGDALMNLCN